MASRPLIGLTMGDPAGVGPELCLSALAESSVLSQCLPVLFGARNVLEPLAAAGITVPSTRVLSLKEWDRMERVEEPLIVDCTSMDAGSLHPGEISAACGRAAFTFIECAIHAAVSGRIGAVVTAPIHKEALRLAGVPQPGHTEIFTDLTGASRSCMMLYSDVLTVSMVTTHVGYAEVPGRLSVDRVRDVIELTAEAMQRMLKRPPRLGVCGLNPHAGEHGLFGQREEEQFIQPAVAQAREQGLAVEGPLAPDTAFTVGWRKSYDAIVTQYHDQGHIPFKMLAFDTGVNITLGLPIIRTSVDHGTAFDIAWKGTANPESLFSAIRVAVEMTDGMKKRGKAA